MPSSTERALLEKIEALSLLRLLNDRLAAADDFPAACRVLVELLWEEGGLRPAAFFSVDSIAQRACLEAVAPALSGAAARITLPLAAFPFANALDHAEATLLPNPLERSDPHAASLPWLGIPLRVRGTPIGFLAVEATIDESRREDDARLLAILATSAALALNVSRDGERAEFVAMLRHDIANPLSTALGYTELLAEELTPDRGDPATLATLLTIKEQLRAIADLVSNYLHMAAIDRALPALQREDVDLRQLLADVDGSLGLTAIHKGLTLAYRVDYPQVRGDRRQLQRVLMNLVSNAIKYTPSPGAVDVAVERDGEWATISVRDNGLGIALEEQARVFEKYARFHTDHEIPGTGLGLFLSRTIVEAHGGTITLESCPGMGSTFCVRLPLDCPA